jgi:alpha,alpha-trehalase
MLLRVYDVLRLKESWNGQVGREWMQRGVRASVKELLGVWMAKPRLDDIGMCKYHPEGIGIPPETEPSHFDHVLLPFATKYGVTVKEFVDLYQSGKVIEKGLDEYFLHDRAVRESGHDTTYRFEKRCAFLATVDLNSLIYKYEVDVCGLVQKYYNGRVGLRVKRGVDDLFLKGFLKWKKVVEVYGGKGVDKGWDSYWARGIVVLEDYNVVVESSGIGYVPPQTNESFFLISIPATLFHEMSETMREKVERYCWDNETKMYYDYDCSIQVQSIYKSATTFWTLWAGIPTPERAKEMVDAALIALKEVGGLVSGTEDSRGMISLDRPNRQWDYPFGWAPHQILAWEGLKKYGFNEEKEELVYRWLYVITKSFVDFNGVVPEKFDVVETTHLVDVEYGNVGVDFEGVVMEGFGWMNASVQVGLREIGEGLKRVLANVTHPDDVFK